MELLPILYSFRRCPYAMRGRLGLFLGNQSVILREIILKNKPQAMLDISPKGTVPVLQLQDGSVIDESLDIMVWGLTQNQSPEANFLLNGNNQQKAIMQLIEENDQQFKPWLDKYKYADRHLEQSKEEYRQQCEIFIQQLEERLTGQEHLMGEQPTLADYAVFPFIRQFAHVDKKWFEGSPYPQTGRWLQTHLTSPIFSQIMKKFPQWLDDPQDILFSPK
ncbi:glutathione S-transferase [Vibrio sp. SS-MA-C1-2]|uniref:glutathione S-transferase n=1 Tax=Vibrio sp. SS-MA-C1-2 TaxID=2908646 RepID=UPI001F46C9B5|nr:glutathione S-transferase [Vibrio sp. SS-MA-C1-2]UJF17447.1 glutathione S-transferase [Vibrio sp. SS-MA-C1-2]